MHPKFDLTGVRTHDLQIITVHFMHSDAYSYNVIISSSHLGIWPTNWEASKLNLWYVIFVNRSGHFSNSLEYTCNVLE